MSSGVGYSGLASLSSLGGNYGPRQTSQALYGNPFGQSNYIPYGAYTGSPGPSGIPAPATPIPREGIRAGEITAYRVWALTKENNWLKSVTADKIWLPDEVMEGDVEKNGIYCFRHPAYAEEAFANDIPCVYGSIEIWGEIVEHEKGYRAQYARIKSLDVVWGVKEETRGWLIKRRTRRAQDILEGLHWRYNLGPMDGLAKEAA